jgi:hypothetical protein
MLNKTKMKNLVKIIELVPDELFHNANLEISQIKWGAFSDMRSENAVFETSQALHLRTHKTPDTWTPTTIDEWSSILECADIPTNINRLPRVVELVKWIEKTVNGIELGRVMIVNLKPFGKVSLHIDPNVYFEKFSRFHVPFKTNKLVYFSGEDLNIKEHMPLKHLCRLNNRLPHQLINESDENRIHLIVDMQIEGNNKIF